jgi:hypothetical protein
LATRTTPVRLGIVIACNMTADQENMSVVFCSDFRASTKIDFAPRRRCLK